MSSKKAPGLSAVRYELRDKTSNKFWQIELNKTSFTTTYGRIGSDGQSSTKTFDSKVEVKLEYERLVSEKVKKGYQRVSGMRSSAKEMAPLTSNVTRAAGVSKGKAKSASQNHKLWQLIEGAKEFYDIQTGTPDPKAADALQRETGHVFPPDYVWFLNNVGSLWAECKTEELCPVAVFGAAGKGKSKALDLVRASQNNALFKLGLSVESADGDHEDLRRELGKTWKKLDDEDPDANGKILRAELGLIPIVAKDLGSLQRGPKNLDEAYALSKKGTLFHIAGGVISRAYTFEQTLAVELCVDLGSEANSFASRMSKLFKVKW